MRNWLKIELMLNRGEYLTKTFEKKNRIIKLTEVLREALFRKVSSNKRSYLSRKIWNPLKFDDASEFDLDWGFQFMNSENKRVVHVSNIRDLTPRMTF